MRAIELIDFICPLVIAASSQRFCVLFSLQQIHLSEVHGFKIDRVMAALAIAPEAAIVLVIGGVAAETIARQLDLVGGLAMTVGALHFGVLTRERKLCFRMIEQNAFPTFRGMARIALIAERTFMPIVFFVADDAACRSVLEGRTDMTALARHHGV